MGFWRRMWLEGKKKVPPRLSDMRPTTSADMGRKTNFPQYIKRTQPVGESFIYLERSVL